MGKYYFNFVKKIARKIYKKREVVFEEPLTEPLEDCVFVSNHSGIMGPVVSTLYLNCPNKIWMTDVLLNKKTSANYCYHDFLFGRSQKHKKLMRVKAFFMSRLFRPLFVKNDQLIFVHKDGLKIKETFKQSISALEEKNNLVIFPESHKRYKKFVHKFNEGFVDLARFYYAKTQKCLTFFPMYIGDKLATINVGKPIVYNPNNEKLKERERLVTYLNDSIEDIAEKLPNHKVIPYVPQVFYDYYGEFENDEMGYLNFANSKKSD